ncbi:MAG: hypothetical protein SOY99_06650 [Alloprevotella sp.]|nr:hypothetical protein [Alloprevotella sp.]
MNKIISILLYMGIAIGLLSCSDETYQPVSLQSNQTSLCKNNIPVVPSIKNTNSWMSEEGEYFKYEATKDGGLTLTHVNAIFSCNLDSVTTSVTSNANNISIKENVYDPANTNCVCPYDITTKLTGFTKGTYTITITTQFGQVHQITFDYSASLSGKKSIL